MEENHSRTSTKNFIFVALTAHHYQHDIYTTTIACRATPAGGRDEEGTGGMRERGVRVGGGITTSSGGRGETGGGEKAAGGGRKETAGRGHPQGRAGVKGEGVVTG